ncbi:hypothetical protein O3Q52_38960 [Streptomyces sp. ActVer]|uniref:hypothetical protein n=1 Tax=Streptomyces sp. ActVer TaxID=3014558 RepID=UPI0022B42899|nr:hypothetical protein [Streptomyces sp. ActVer]MCZ4514017.1 hypothetical protein [Streptomyces sp. ActVer]
MGSALDSRTCAFSGPAPKSPAPELALREDDMLLVVSRTATESEVPAVFQRRPAFRQAGGRAG